MQRISSRQPLLLGIGVTLTFMFGLLFAVLVLPDSVVPAGKVAIRMLVPVALLTILGLWRSAGFTRRPTWSNLWPFLPLLLIPLVPAIFGTGVTITDPAEIALPCSCPSAYTNPSRTTTRAASCIAAASMATASSR